MLTGEVFCFDQGIVIQAKLPKYWRITILNEDLYALKGNMLRCALKSDFKLIVCSSDFELDEYGYESFVDQDLYTISMRFGPEFSSVDINQVYLRIKGSQETKDVIVPLTYKRHGVNGF